MADKWLKCLNGEGKKLDVHVALGKIAKRHAVKMYGWRDAMLKWNGI